jgi:hypothetical protein
LILGAPVQFGGVSQAWGLGGSAAISRNVAPGSGSGLSGDDIGCHWVIEPAAGEDEEESGLSSRLKSQDEFGMGSGVGSQVEVPR